MIKTSTVVWFVKNVPNRHKFVKLSRFILKFYTYYKLLREYLFLIALVNIKMLHGPVVTTDEKQMNIAQPN
jgi:hypothetical protein